MELIELDATAQRALELLTNAGMSDGSIYDYIDRWAVWLRPCRHAAAPAVTMYRLWGSRFTALREIR